MKRTLKPQQRWQRLAKFALAGLGLGALALAAVYYLLPLTSSIPSQFEEELPSTRLYSAEGYVWGFVAGEDYYRQEPLKKLDTNSALVRALLAAEDKRFFEHGGIDLIALGRACWQNSQHGGVLSGASTLTMQLAKMGLAQTQRTLSHKLKEALLARHLEMKYTKQELLLLYLNHADFGHLCRGAEAAAWHYFSKEAQQLNEQEAALLVAQLQSPTRNNPFQHPERARAARNRILDRMAAPAALKRNELGLKVPQERVPMHLAQRAKQGGHLTINAGLQAATERIVREEINLLHPKNVQQAAVLVIDNHDGSVLVSLPSANPQHRAGGQLNGTLIRRSAGSTLKPFVYALSLRQGKFTGTVYPDLPTQFADASGIDAPHNYNQLYLGPISMRRALACSQNIPALLALNEAGGAPALLDLLAQLGFKIAEGDYGLGLAIGNAHVSLEELARSFSALAREGMLPELRYKKDSPCNETRVFTAAEAYLLSDMLADADARLSSFGRAPALRFPFRVAAKTGTSSNFRDNWCIGYTSEYTVAVWVGNFDNSAMQNVSGLSGAGPIFHRVLQLVHKGHPASFPPCPAGVERVPCDTRTGKTLHSATSKIHIDPSNRKHELTLSESDLPEAQPEDYDHAGRARLSHRYATWLAKRNENIRALYCIDDETQDKRRPRILRPADGSTAYLDAMLREHGQWFPLESTLNPNTARWSCSSLQIELRNGRYYARIEAGEHELFVHDPTTGNEARCRFRVIQR